jgi:hypothetical protein
MCLTAARLPARVDVSAKLKSLVEQDRSRRGSKARARRPETFGAFGVRQRTHRLSSRGDDRIRSFRGSTRGGSDWKAIANCDGAVERHNWRGLNVWRMLNARDPSGGLMRSARSLTAIALRDIRSTRLEFRRGSLNSAREHFRAALDLARNPTERRFLEQRVNACHAGGSPSVGH